MYFVQDTLKGDRRNNRNSNVNSLIMCFDTESIQTNDGVLDDSDHDDTAADSAASPAPVPVFAAEQLAARPFKTFESHFNFPPLAQLEDIDISDEESWKLLWKK